MRNLALATTALYLTLASAAFADSNSLIISQASVGATAPTLNFTQSGSGAAASIIQNGNDTLTGVQVGTGGTKLNVDQENPTAGAVNTINYTGRGNSNVTVYQRAANGIFTAPGSAGNTANIDIAGTTGGTNPNTLALDQVGFNNTATVYDSLTNYVGLTNHDQLQIGQYSDSAVSGNKAQFTNNGIGTIDYLYLVQKGGNTANFSVLRGESGAKLTQINTADNAAVGNTANVTFGDTVSGGGILDFTQNGTLNTLTANMGGSGINIGMTGWQNGTRNQANVTQVEAYIFSGAQNDVLEQTGTNNIANATQNATHNSLFSIIQNGNNDNATVLQTGTNNVASLTQTGNLNVASLTQSGTGATATLVQH